MPRLRRRELLAALALGALPGRRAAAQPQAGSAPLQLLRTGDIGGLPWIELPLQGMATRWLVDSGASAAVIAPALAERLQLRPLSPISVALAGGVQTLPRYRLPDFADATEGAASAAIALDLQQLLGEAGGRLDGALGAPWLRQRITRFDFAAGRLHWGPSAAALPPGAAAAASSVTASSAPAVANAALPSRAAVLPLRWDQGLPVVSLALGARAAEGFVFDTGNAGALLLFARSAAALRDEVAALPTTTVRELGGSVHAGFARIERLIAPGWVAHEVPAALESGDAPPRGMHFDRLAGSLGVALFEPGAVTLDGPGARLIVELPGLPDPPALPGGFGFRLVVDNGLRIGAVIAASPAALAAVQAGDAVQAIDGADARAWSPAQAWQQLAGRDQVMLQLFAQGRSRYIELRRERFFPLLR